MEHLSSQLCYRKSLKGHHHTRLLNVSSSLCLPHPSASPFLFSLLLLFFYFPFTPRHVSLSFNLLPFHIPITPCLPHPSSPPIPHLGHPFSSYSLTSPSLLLMPPPPCLLLYISITPLDAYSFTSMSQSLISYSKSSSLLLLLSSSFTPPITSSLTTLFSA